MPPWLSRYEDICYGIECLPTTHHITLGKDARRVPVVHDMKNVPGVLRTKLKAELDRKKARGITGYTQGPIGGISWM